MLFKGNVKETNNRNPHSEDCCQKDEHTAKHGHQHGEKSKAEHCCGNGHHDKHGRDHEHCHHHN